MAYDKEKILQQSMEVIAKQKLFFIEDIVALLPCSKTTFYDFFPPNSDELNEIKDRIENNRVDMKIRIRKKWFDSDRDTGLMALYKIICTPEERQMLSMTEVKITGTGEQPLFDLGLLTVEERKVWYALYDKATGKPITIDIPHEEVQPKKLLE